MTRRYRICVVGFGMAGGLSAHLLAKAGHEIVLLERAGAVGPVGAGVLLQVSGQTVLHHVGLLDRVLAHAAPLEELYARQLDGRQLIRTRYADFEPGTRAYGVHRGVLFDAIHAAVRAQPVDVRLGCDVVARSVESTGVFVSDACGRRHGPFDFILTGDGSRSKLRAALGFRAHVCRYAHGTLWAIAPSRAVEGRLLQVVRGSRKLFGQMPMGDGLSTLYWGLPVREYAAVVARGMGPLKAEILSYAPEAAEILDAIHDFSQLLLTSYQHVWMPRKHDRHTFFLGDAAHAMSPHLGQGINLAMVDAWRFAACLRDAPNPYAAFCTFRERQRAYLRYYAMTTYALSPFFQSDYPLLAWGRDRALPVLPKIPWVRRQMAMTVAGLKGGFLRGRIEI